MLALPKPYHSESKWRVIQQATDRFLFQRHYTFNNNKMASGPTFTHLIMYPLRIYTFIMLCVCMRVCKYDIHTYVYNMHRPLVWNTSNHFFIEVFTNNSDTRQFYLTFVRKRKEIAFGMRTNFFLGCCRSTHTKCCCCCCCCCVKSNVTLRCVSLSRIFSFLETL